LPGVALAALIAAIKQETSPAVHRNTALRATGDARAL